MSSTGQHLPHPLFWAVDINCGLSDFATVCLFFDILMEGRLDPQTGDYSVEVVKDTDDFGTNGENDFDKFKSGNNGGALGTSNTNPLSSGNGAG